MFSICLFACLCMSSDFTTCILSDNQRSNIPILFHLDFVRVNYSMKYSIYMYVYILSIISWSMFLESKLHPVHKQIHIDESILYVWMYECINVIMHLINPNWQHQFSFLLKTPYLPLNPQWKCRWIFAIQILTKITC